MTMKIEVDLNDILRDEYGDGETLAESSVARSSTSSRLIFTSAFTIASTASLGAS
jgi:hypothetical protein